MYAIKKVFNCVYRWVFINLAPFPSNLVHFNRQICYIQEMNWHWRVFPLSSFNFLSSFLSSSLFSLYFTYRYHNPFTLFNQQPDYFPNVSQTEIGVSLTFYVSKSTKAHQHSHRREQVRSQISEMKLKIYVFKYCKETIHQRVSWIE